MLVTEESYKLPEQKEKFESSSSSPVLKPKTFFWDRIISSLASAIFGLTISGIIVDFLKSDENFLACFSSFENRAQYTYINSYCHKHLAREEFFTLLLVGQSALLVAPHYLWNVYFSAEFDSFFSHVARIEILREGNTGKYPHKNYRMVSYLKREFGNRQHILIGYLIKLAIQLTLVLVMIFVNGIVFTEMNNDIMFQCSDDKEDYQVFGNVTCANPRKLYINILKGIDYGLLGLAGLVLIFGVGWWIFCFFSNEHYEKTAQFCYESCIDPQYYYKLSRISPLRFKMNDDFEFLLALLNFGLRRVFITILTKSTISKIYGQDLQEFTKKGNYVYVAVASYIHTI